MAEEKNIKFKTHLSQPSSIKIGGGIFLHLAKGKSYIEYVYYLSPIHYIFLALKLYSIFNAADNLSDVFIPDFCDTRYCG